MLKMNIRSRIARASIVILAILAGGYFLYLKMITSGEFTSGDYRGIAIGTHKVDVISFVTSPGLTGLKIISFEGEQGQTVPIFARECGSDLWKANTWYLTYPGIQKEIVTVRFSESRVSSISYRRDFLAP